MPLTLSPNDHVWLKRVRKVALETAKQTPEEITNFMALFDGSSALGNAMVWEYCAYRQSLGLSTIIKRPAIGMHPVAHRSLRGSGAENSDTCTICQEGYYTGDDPEDPVQVKCGHIFGRKCISSWTIGDETKRPHSSCPVCRATLVHVMYLLDAQGSSPPQGIPYNVQSAMVGIAEIIYGNNRDPKYNEQVLDPAISLLALSECYRLPPKCTMSAAEIYSLIREDSRVPQHPSSAAAPTLRVFEMSTQIEACRLRLLPVLRFMGAKTLWDSQPFTVWSFLRRNQLTLIVDFVEQLLRAGELLTEARKLVASTSLL